MANVTFEPGCRNNWHVHHASKGGGQILLCTNGRGWYQEWNREARELFPGDVVFIPAGVKHWHGAARDSWFSHVAFEAPAKTAPMSGWSRWTMSSTASSGNQPGFPVKQPRQQPSRWVDMTKVLGGTSLRSSSQL